MRLATDVRGIRLRAVQLEEFLGYSLIYWITVIIVQKLICVGKRVYLDNFHQPLIARRLADEL